MRDAMTSDSVSHAAQVRGIYYLVLALTGFIATMMHVGRDAGTASFAQALTSIPDDFGHPPRPRHTTALHDMRRTIREVCD
jgi:hypothetical protein